MSSTATAATARRNRAESTAMAHNAADRRAAETEAARSGAMAGTRAAMKLAAAEAADLAADLGRGPTGILAAAAEAAELAAWQRFRPTVSAEHLADLRTIAPGISEAEAEAAKRAAAEVSIPETAAAIAAALLARPDRAYSFTPHRRAEVPADALLRMARAATAAAVRAEGRHSWPGMSREWRAERAADLVTDVMTSAMEATAPSAPQWAAPPTSTIPPTAPGYRAAWIAAMRDMAAEHLRADRRRIEAERAAEAETAAMVDMAELVDRQRAEGLEAGRALAETLAETLAAEGRPLTMPERTAAEAELSGLTRRDYALARNVGMEAAKKTLQRGRAALAARWSTEAEAMADLRAAEAARMAAMEAAAEARPWETAPRPLTAAMAAAEGSPRTYAEDVLEALAAERHAAETMEAAERSGARSMPSRAERTAEDEPRPVTVTWAEPAAATSSVH